VLDDPAFSVEEQAAAAKAMSIAIVAIARVRTRSCFMASNQHWRQVGRSVVIFLRAEIFMFCVAASEVSEEFEEKKSTDGPEPTLLNAK
jgi:F0F1-type ATP synthase beta subunit